MDLWVEPDGHLVWQGQRLSCAIGRGGIRTDKREGDGATPVGCFALRRVLYRADRIATLRSGLACQSLRPNDGWCDDPADPAYNTAVQLPYPGRYEDLWRDDNVYDIIVVLGHNDSPVVAGAGSAIFMHIAKDGYPPTEGCIALHRDDLIAVLKTSAPGDRLCVSQPV